MSVCLSVCLSTYTLMKQIINLRMNVFTHPVE